ncbi:MAG TPA: hypothetical protein PKE44_17405 [Plasticicumulans sp.]|uniref:hypothetical protein n=1 Tax=Plasticicumulans sp. TaxID=2307179 RepID=UPI002C23B66C|nr:hypothetical protein [Plasticicumulans sp.]HMW31339.1 hypothetical protein [Plasticicumulans sp.]HNF67586.1 hypothetical protein [Plasticicumulans sp.]
MILFDLDALECAAAQKSATAANPAKPANRPLAAAPDPLPISGISGISDAGGFCFPERSQPTAPAAVLLAGADQEPVGHCAACGSPSWWRAADGADWCCSYCSPRPQPFTGTSLTLACGWRAGTAPPADPDDEPAPAVRPADGRVQNAYGAWRLPAEHAAVEDYDRHHWQCTVCRRAGSGYGDRCAEGERLHAATRIALSEAIQGRMVGRVGNPSLKANSGNISGIERGDSRDIAARAAGLGSGKTLEGAP